MRRAPAGLPFVLALFGLALAPAATAAAMSPEHEGTGRWKLREARIVATPDAGHRFRVQGRIAAQEAAGELREAGRFVVLGRIAKRGQLCSADAVFSDGFETG